MVSCSLLLIQLSYNCLNRVALHSLCFIVLLQKWFSRSLSCTPLCWVPWEPFVPKQQCFTGQTLRRLHLSYLSVILHRRPVLAAHNLHPIRTLSYKLGSAAPLTCCCKLIMRCGFTPARNYKPRGKTPTRKYKPRVFTPTAEKHLRGKTTTADLQATRFYTYRGKTTTCFSSMTALISHFRTQHDCVVYSFVLFVSQ